MRSKADIRRGSAIPVMPASEVSMKKNDSFYGRSLPRPTLIGEPDRSVRDVAKDQRIAFTSVTQALMGVQHDGHSPPF